MLMFFPSREVKSSHGFQSTTVQFQVSITFSFPVMTSTVTSYVPGNRVLSEYELLLTPVSVSFFVPLTYQFALVL